MTGSTAPLPGAPASPALGADPPNLPDTTFADASDAASASTSGVMAATTPLPYPPTPSDPATLSPYRVCPVHRTCRSLGSGKAQRVNAFALRPRHRGRPRPPTLRRSGKSSDDLCFGATAIRLALASRATRESDLQRMRPVSERTRSCPADSLPRSIRPMSALSVPRDQSARRSPAPFRGVHRLADPDPGGSH